MIAALLSKPALYALAAVVIAALIGGGWLYVGHLNATIEQQAETIAAGRAALETAKAVNAESVAALDRLHADIAAGQRAAADATAAARAADDQVSKLKREVRRAQTPTDPPVSASLRAALDGLRLDQPARGDDPGPGRAGTDPGRTADVPAGAGAPSR